MARYEGRHRASRATSAPAVPTVPGIPSSRSGTPAATRVASPPRAGSLPRSGRHEAVRGGPQVELPTAATFYDRASSRARSGVGGGGNAAAPPLTRRALKARTNQPRRSGRPVLVGALALGLGASAVGFATADMRTADAAFVVGDNVVAQTAELARTSTVDMTYRAAASVSRNERRTAIVATGLRSAAALEAKKKEEAARLAEQRRLAEEAAERERMREQVIANAKENPQAAARILLADHGFTSDAQFNCLVNLWNGESGWRWYAENPSSGAYGIPQSLPASKMGSFGADYRTNPITQMKWGIWYIEQVYGSPCNAWSTWLSRSPHWY
ncbi:lytic transglycosylase domain-containing protein [Intrasporangium sp. DVR]|uniref:aggregation-promoting factor C-terminal-like domain-containing protein n=1 Tax=Intrasporangium sp. DVR TaxID=3127867 RepID=UPI00313A66F6